MEEFTMTDGDFYVTKEVRDAWERDGAILVRGLWNTKEVAKLQECMEVIRLIT